MRALEIAATGMQAQQTRVEVIANNISNVGTTGYNIRRAEFADLLYQQAQRAGEVSSDTGTVVPAGIQLGLGVRTAAVAMQPAQGTLRQTNGQLDLALEGRGWFEIELPSGDSAYTRDGSFKLSPDGQVVTSEGYPLVPSITVPADARSVSVNADGQVFAIFDNGQAPQELGKITLATFINEKGLEARGSNLFTETTASGDAQVGDSGTDGRGSMRQGYLEQSSVDIVTEITQLIEAQRAYEMNSKVITAADQMLAAANQVR
ncbi:MAG: flagellar basal-body rod protein FlgG [Alphaproteobacteria bacterium]|nr:flagellar basal-body rod protein FlgG [Alphaproteobacteria bacterium]MCB9928757.1 flagellar basal-body rod protein FlgG [Alphaproteobacteria bacterium]